MNVQQEIAEMKAILFGSKTALKMAVKPVLVNNDYIYIFNSETNESESTRFSDFLNQVASGDIVFEEEVIDTVATGRVIIKQEGFNKLIIGKAAQTNQYDDLDGLPNLANFITFDQLISQNNIVRTIDLGTISYDSSVQTKEQVIVQAFNALTTIEKTISDTEIVFLDAILQDGDIDLETKYIVTKGKGSADITDTQVYQVSEKTTTDLQVDVPTFLNRKYKGSNVYAILLTVPAPTGENYVFNHNLAINKYLRVESWNEITGSSIGSHADLSYMATDITVATNDITITGWDFESGSTLYIEYTK